MKLNSTIFWAFIALVAFLLYQLLYVLTDGDFHFVSISYAVGYLMALLLVPAAVSMLISIIISLFSIRKKQFKKKLIFISPLIFLTILVLCTVVSFLYKKGEGLSDLRTKWLVKYKDVKSPKGLNCASIKTGRFSTRSLEIERNDSIQTQLDKIENANYTYDVLWLTPSEYMLIDRDKSNQKLFVKVMAVDESSYSCFFTTDTNARPPSYFIKVIKRKEN